MKTFVAILGSVALVSGAATLAPSQAAPVKPDPAKAPSRCFFNNQVTSYRASDDQTLYVRAGRNVYRMDTLGRCIDLRNSLNIALDSSPSSSICNAQDVTVLVHADGLGPQRCAVRTLTRLTPEELAALPKKDRP